MTDQDYDLEDRLLHYAAGIMRLEERLPKSRSGNHAAGQIIRCGTSPLSNHGETQGAESRADFIHKFSICFKELKETRRWLKLIRLVPLVEDATETNRLLDETEQLIKIFASSIATARRRGE